MNQSRGAYSVGGSAPGDNETRRRGLGWLWWLLLALGIVALAAFLIARNSNDAGDDRGIDVTDDPAAPGQTDEQGPGAEGDAESDDGSSPDPAPESPSSDPTTTPSTASVESPIVAEGAALLPPPDLGPLDTKTATATGVTVESVVSDEGFWVGSAPDQRLFVRLATAAESPFQVAAGQRVSFTAVVTAVPAGGAQQWGINASEGAQLLESQRYYLSADVASLRQG